MGESHFSFVEKHNGEMVSSKRLKVQVFGDGYRQFQRLKIANFAVRVHGATNSANAIDALDPIGIWERSEDFDTVKERCTALVEYMEDAHKKGGILLDLEGKDRQVKVITE